mmetsp:Transcript_20681/g.32362  ORF Transcript_20681/g.32362 Transcript_20681/m.32362 type:complete len:340 (-) Transcript_20681:337-1356(-)
MLRHLNMLQLRQCRRSSPFSRLFMIDHLLLIIVLISSTLLHNDIIVSASSSIINDKQHLAAIAELKRLVPPPLTTNQRSSSEVDAINDDAYYARFLSINEWDPIKTESNIRQSIEWRLRVQPQNLRPRHCPILCRQYAWLALTTGPGSKMMLMNDEPGDVDANVDNRNRKKKKQQKQQLPLDPPYNSPPLQSWRTTKHGLPITYFRCWKWKPELASSDESEKHLAYHIHHLLRRIPTNRNNKQKDISRICVIFDMRGFSSAMLPHIHKCINILRCQYPGRAGAMCFINVPVYFTTVWKIISPWLDEEIRTKVFFAERGVDDVEKAVEFLNGMELKTGLY